MMLKEITKKIPISLKFLWIIISNEEMGISGEPKQKQNQRSLTEYIYLPTRFQQIFCLNSTSQIFLEFSYKIPGQHCISNWIHRSPGIILWNSTSASSANLCFRGSFMTFPYVYRRYAVVLNHSIQFPQSYNEFILDTAKPFGIFLCTCHHI